MNAVIWKPTRRAHVASAILIGWWLISGIFGVLLAASAARSGPEAGVTLAFVVFGILLICGILIPLLVLQILHAVKAPRLTEDETRLGPGRRAHRFLGVMAYLTAINGVFLADAHLWMGMFSHPKWLPDFMRLIFGLAWAGGFLWLGRSQFNHARRLKNRPCLSVLRPAVASAVFLLTSLVVDTAFTLRQRSAYAALALNFDKVRTYCQEQALLRRQIEQVQSRWVLQLKKAPDSVIFPSLLRYGTGYGTNPWPEEVRKALDASESINRKVMDAKNYDLIELSDKIDGQYFDTGLLLHQLRTDLRRDVQSLTGSRHKDPGIKPLWDLDGELWQLQIKNDDLLTVHKMNLDALSNAEQTTKKTTGTLAKWRSRVLFWKRFQFLGGPFWAVDELLIRFQ